MFTVHVRPIGLLLLFLAGCQSPLETVAVPIEGGTWKVGHTQDFGRGRGTIAEYIPAEESLPDWSRMVSIQFLEGMDRDPEGVANELRASMAERCPGVEWQILNRGPRSVLYEWRIADCGDNPDQHEIARILRGKDGVHRVAYVSKGSEIDVETRAAWIERLGTVEVIKDGEPVFGGSGAP